MLTRELNLDRFATYIRREVALKWAAWGLVAGLGIALLVNSVAWVFPILTFGPRIALSMGISAGVTLFTLLVAHLYPRSPMDIARLSDARMRLRARLATALEIQAGLLPVPLELAARQRADARAAAERADPEQAFTLRFPRRQALIAAVLLAFLIVGFALPNPQEARIARRQAEREAIEKQIDRLERLRDQVVANKELSQEDKEILLRELDDAVRDLREGELSREEAVARLSEVEGKLKELLDEEADAQASALREAGRQAAQGESTQEIGQPLSQGDYQGAAQAVESLSARLPRMSAEELASTAQWLEAMADALAEANPELAQALREAAQAMRRGDIEAAQGALERAAERIQQAGQQIAAQEATEQVLGQVQEGRREIAQSGHGQQGQQGQGQQGQGQQGKGQQGQGQQGQGQQGQGQQGQGQQGAGQDGSSSGSGSGDSDSEGQGGQGTPVGPQGPFPPNQPGQEGETPYDPIYAPERLGEGGGERIDVPGQGEGGPPTGETEGEPREGRALVPYNEVYTDYQAQAVSALENSYIPRGMKEYVRAYFSSLDPGR
jgi:hypothetical protein